MLDARRRPRTQTNKHAHAHSTGPPLVVLACGPPPRQCRRPPPPSPARVPAEPRMPNSGPAVPRTHEPAARPLHCGRPRWTAGGGRDVEGAVYCGSRKPYPFTCIAASRCFCRSTSSAILAACAAAATRACSAASAATRRRRSSARAARCTNASNYTNNRGGGGESGEDRVHTFCAICSVMRCWAAFRAVCLARRCCWSIDRARESSSITCES
jgi:hypothetical protein